MLIPLLSLLILWLILAIAPANAVVSLVLTVVWAVVVAYTVSLSSVSLTLLVVVPVIIAVVFLVTPIRSALLSKMLFKKVAKTVPSISATEAAAIEAGTVWWDADLFSGTPSLKRFMSFPGLVLTQEEKDFIAGPLEEICRSCNDWEVHSKYRDLSPETWGLLKSSGILGMLIPKEYGGLGFSFAAQSEIVHKVASHSQILGICVMVPNSLGPAELLLHYGTEAQKKYYLPRLAKGEEIPAFALTSPLAGSDAASITDSGVVCRGLFDGQEVLGVRLNWSKRYITLSPLCTLLGLAVKLYDPDHLIGHVEEIGITCFLIPTHLPGVVIGRRHKPLVFAFQNGPNQGHDVFVPLDYIIGGQANAGKGWRMLMECLSVGRGISLPGLAAGQVKLALRSVGAYAALRRQFKLPVARFEGVEEKLADLAVQSYVIEAARRFTSAALSTGEKPSVVTALMKYHATERGRLSASYAMDILGGKAICMGPKNFIANAYRLVPVSITVEGANILTRSLMIFGQGAIRCHPYVLKEMNAVRGHGAEALSAFDQAFWGHARFMVRNALRSLWYGVTGHWGVCVDGDASPEVRHYFKQLKRVSTAFAFVSDISMAVLGGQMKRRESLSARLGDILSEMYLISATLKRYELEGRDRHMLPVVHMAVQSSFYNIALAFKGFLSNFPHRGWRCFMRLFSYPFGVCLCKPSDRYHRPIVDLVTKAGPARDALSNGIFYNRDRNHVLYALDEALLMDEPVQMILKKIQAVDLDCKKWESSQVHLERALAKGVVTQQEYDTLCEYWRLMDLVVNVDDFPADASVA